MLELKDEDIMPIIVTTFYMFKKLNGNMEDIKKPMGKWKLY